MGAISQQGLEEGDILDREIRDRDRFKEGAVPNCF